VIFRWIGIGAASVALTGLLWTAVGLGRFVLGVGAFGVFAVWHGVSIRLAVRGSDRNGWLRRRFEIDRFEHGDVQWLPDLRVHGAGLVVSRPVHRRFVPWETVSRVRLTPDELVVERRRRFDLRCDRAAIDAPERVYEEIERSRAGKPGRRPAPAIVVEGRRVRRIRTWSRGIDPGGSAGSGRRTDSRAP
jgi:hypothetical protein